MIIHVDFNLDLEGVSEELKRIKILLKRCSDIIEHGREESIKKDALDQIKYYL